jgi:hypothetical protein
VLHEPVLLNVLNLLLLLPLLLCFQVGDTISELAADLLPKNLWPELLPALNQLVAAGNPAHMQAALNILANLATYSSDSLRPHLGGLHPLLGSCLQHRDLDVQVGAAGA